MASAEGVLIASNYCRNQKCEPAAQREALAVVAYQRIRLRDEERWES